MTTKDEDRAATDILQSFGFSRVWILDNDDRSEVVFLVLPTENVRVDREEVIAALQRAVTGKILLVPHVPVETRVLYE